MKRSNVKLIFLREVRDQLRDRRTLFTIAVLPLLLYPLLGMSFLQVSQFMHEQPTRVWIVGVDQLPDEPQLLVGESFEAELLSVDEARLLSLDTKTAVPSGVTTHQFPGYARDLIQQGEFAAVVRFPAGFRQALQRFRSLNRAAEKTPGQADRTVKPDAGEELAGVPQLPTPELIFDAASDKSRMANARVRRVLSNWQRAIVRQYLSDRNISLNVTDPFSIKDVDVSVELTRRAAFWSKVLPFIVFIWALTGAFYPAVDLCAGEKERGTLETLLSSPAQRSEIVVGKLLTIMGFSSATSLLNLLSMAVTGTAVIMLKPGQFPIGSPPLSALAWLLLALLPISALFSALALAIAAFARSTKEGQYYLMPLLLISLPLMILPLLPAVELNLGTSLIPVTGMMLLLRALVEGQYAEAALFAPPVLLVTAGCCFLAIRWAVDQFNNESVLFRESERTDIRLWLRHLIRVRGATPTVGQAVACGLILLTIRFFATFAAKSPESWDQFASMQFVTLAALVGLPTLLLTFLLTRSPSATLLLRPAAPKTLAMAILLAVTIHPLAMLITTLIQQLYPINEQVVQQIGEIKQLMMSAPSMWHIVALMALTPAICEELAFRGFILSGLRHTGSKWNAIFVSSLFFGITHGILQQSISAAMVGMVIGYLAVQTGSLLPCIGFHLVYNSLGLTSVLGLGRMVHGNAWLDWFFVVSEAGDGVSYRWFMVVLGSVASLLILNWFCRLPHLQTAEETLRKALSHQSAGAAAS